MRVAIFTDSFFPKVDGVGVSVQNFCERLEERGHEFIICCPRYGENDTERIGRNIRVERFKSIPVPSYEEMRLIVPGRKKLHRVIREFQPQLIHIQTPGFLGQYGVLAAKIYSIPVIGTYHTMMSEVGMYVNPLRLLKLDKLLQRVRRRKKIASKLHKITRKKPSLGGKLLYQLANRLYEKCQLVITPSELIKKELLSKGFKKPITVVSNGIDLQFFRGEKRIFPEDEPRLLHVGRLALEKNPEEVVRAFALIKDKIPRARMTIVGDGPLLVELKRDASALGIADSITFTGYLPRQKLPQIYAEHDLFITASAMETQGLVALEAVAMGLPAVGTNAYALPELIQDGRNGFCVTPHDVPALAEAALRILQNKEFYERASLESLAIAKEHSHERSTDKLERIYLEAIR
ncbi:MAG: glycosyltransferase [Turneriella sp.]|nr:glycosyltransferase [Leptospiraceae bacterium]MCX7632440.1 glycosyltransferase [Turneriella sp.]